MKGVVQPKHLVTDDRPTTNAEKAAVALSLALQKSRS
jgi:hypothetical protein